MTIEIIKTFHGKRYAVLEPFTYSKKNDEGKLVTVTENYAVEYREGNKVKVAVFPVTKQGLKEAKEVMASLSKNSKRNKSKK